jgi:hypothetical protein
MIKFSVPISAGSECSPWCRLHLYWSQTHFSTQMWTLLYILVWSVATICTLYFTTVIKEAWQVHGKLLCLRNVGAEKHQHIMCSQCPPTTFLVISYNKCPLCNTTIDARHVVTCLKHQACQFVTNTCSYKTEMNSLPIWLLIFSIFLLF